MNKKVFGTLEWASHNENFINGCLHDCLYCYSKEMAIRFKRKDTFSWHIEKVNPEKLLKPAKKYDGRVMVPSSHDITPGNLFDTIQFLTKLASVGNSLLIVSKPHKTCIETICKKLQDYKKNILFRFTIGSNNSDILKKWEPNAPSFEERFECLKIAKNEGYGTSLSIEPMLDSIDKIEVLIDQCMEYISDSIWVGKPNFLFRRVKTNGNLSPEIQKEISFLIKNHNDRNIKALYKKYYKNEKVKWKDSIKSVVGISTPEKAGQDI
jgi:DNA repair photolyase